MNESLLARKKVILVIANEGYQATELNVPRSILEKEGIKIYIASDKPGGAIAHDKSTTTVDLPLDAIKITDYDGIFFIGGPGALEHLDNTTSYHLISEAKKNNIPYGAICISTRILAKAYGLQGKRATGWNGDLALKIIYLEFGAQYEDEPMITDELVVTARDPQAAELFADGIKRVLTKKILSQQS